MSEATVSVVMPAYNSGRTIEAAVRSALSQSPVTEVIVVDDCSTDDTLCVLGRFKDDCRVRVVTNEHNMGAAESRNRGVSMASGKYIAFLDSDDMWVDGKLEKQLALLDKTGAVLCSTARELVSESGERTGRVIGVPEIVSYSDLLKGNVINCSSVVLDREVALAFPMGDDDVHEDYICWLRILRRYGRSVAVNEPLLLYRQTKGSKSGGRLKSARMTFQVYRRMGFGFLRSCMYFACYAANGVNKYFIRHR